MKLNTNRGISFIKISVIIGDKGKVCQVNNSITFSGKPIEFEDFLNRMVEALGIIIDRCTKGRSLKMES